jgi:hypothetical protein
MSSELTSLEQFQDLSKIPSTLVIGMKKLKNIIDESPEALNSIRLIFEALHTGLTVFKHAEKKPNLIKEINEQYGYFLTLIGPKSTESSRVEIIEPGPGGGRKKARHKKAAAEQRARWNALSPQEQMSLKQKYVDDGRSMQEGFEAATTLGSMAFILVLFLIVVCGKISSWIKESRIPEKYRGMHPTDQEISMEYDERRKDRGGKSKTGRNQTRTQKRRRLVIA